MKDNYSNSLGFLIILLTFSLMTGCQSDSTAVAKGQETEALAAKDQLIADATAAQDKMAKVGAEKETVKKETTQKEAQRIADEKRLEELKLVKKQLEEKAAEEKLAAEKAARAKKRNAAKKEKEKIDKIEAEAAKKAVEEAKNSAGKGKLGFEELTFNFGKVDQGDRVNHEFKFVNTGTESINVTNVTASCGCTQPSYPFLPIEPGKSGVIGVTFDTKGKLGRQKPSLTVNTDGDPGEYKIFLEGFVDSGSEEN